MKTALVIPTYNPSYYAQEFLESLKRQSMQPDVLLIIDSSSTDAVLTEYAAAGFDIHTIAKADFNHGGTRQLAVEILKDVDVIIFLTQDAILADELAVENLLAGFSNDRVACTYGRQLPHADASHFAAHLRAFNYPQKSVVKERGDISRLGIKAAFVSNSFAAYRRETLMKIGGFPTSTIVSEDTYVGAKLLLSGFRIAYCADAVVYHSHNYSLLGEFKRYFDVGVFHAREAWIRQAFCAAEAEGRRFLSSECAYLRRHASWLLPVAVLRNMLKYLGYRLGLCENRLPAILNRHLSSHPDYWKD